jgi:hypothetical protein
MFVTKTVVVGLILKLGQLPLQTNPILLREYTVSMPTALTVSANNTFEIKDE